MTRLHARPSNFYLVAFLLGAVAAWTACSSDTTCIDSAECDPSTADRAGTGDGGGPDAPAGCDLSLEPKDAPKCVDDAVGVFVDAAGSDTSAGTKTAPVKSITAALGKLGGKSRIYICGEGPFTEHVKLTSAVSLYGGFTCGAWTYAGTKAKVTPSDEGVGLEVRSANSPVVISDVAVAVKDATATSSSSVAVFVASSNKLTLRRVDAIAGTGKDGTDATDQKAFLPVNAVKGNDGTADIMSGAEKKNDDCPTSIGGKGGRSTAANGAAGAVAINPAIPAASFTGAGGMTGGLDCTTGFGKNGSYGPGGTSGAGATKLGELTATGWLPANGSAGGAGTPGQGGGGGAYLTGSGIGGSGGPGGCGGAGGEAGTGGGASIAVLVFETPVVIEQSSLTSKNSGRGGKGAKGQKAQLGGPPGAYSNFNDACNGGGGGVGGSGGGGGGGAGGVSAGILYKGTAPTIDGASKSSADTLPSVKLGDAGPKGTKGAGGDPAQISPLSSGGEPGNDGADGTAKALLSAP